MANVAEGQAGSVRGVIFDRDFGAPLAGVQVAIDGTNIAVQSSVQGNYLIGDLDPGQYTLVFVKAGYVRQFKGNVLVLAGELTDLNIYLSGEFDELDDYIVQDFLNLDASSEAGLLQLRLESPALIDSIGADLMSRAGASDAASALKLVSGATVKDGKSAVIRGLPDRYVSSQLNGVILPSADEDKRAIDLDQFPSPVIENIQVTKTFTPDQQGDASGGAVNVTLKDLPEKPFFQVKTEYSYNSQASFRNDFLSYKGGGVNFFGNDGSKRDAQLNSLGQNWNGAVGVSKTGAPTDYKWSATGGGKMHLQNGASLGGLVSLFYERDSSFYNDGINDSWVVDTPGSDPTPQQNQASGNDNFKTALFDVVQGTQSVQWGGLGTIAYETDENKLGLTLLYSRTAEDTATLAEDTRGKAFFFPGYDPNDPNSPGFDSPEAAPYLRTETLDYKERTTGSVQLNGEHTLPFGAFDLGSWKFARPEVDWIAARSFAQLNEPDKRQFGSLWTPGREVFPGFDVPPLFSPFKPGANFNLGNLQRIFKKIREDSHQITASLKLPFDRPNGLDGYVKSGVFHNAVKRDFNQDTYSNTGDNTTFIGNYDDFWSAYWQGQDHPIFASDTDVDYKGDLDVSALYSMLNYPVSDNLTFAGGLRVERTSISVVNNPEKDALWFPPGSPAPVKLNPGDADVDFSKTNFLPAASVAWEATDQLTARASFSQTVARQNFKELTPTIQQEFLGAPIFIGNPDLGLSHIRNYDLRLDYKPYEGGFLSLSAFRKGMKDPIEFIQRVALFNFTTAVNYPKGTLQGIEMEARQDLGHWWEGMEGFSLGANATFLDSFVVLPKADAAGFNLPGIQAPMSKRDMTNTPNHLYNMFLTFDAPDTGTQFSIFYTVRGDTLVQGAAEDGNVFIPSVYETQFGTLNLSLSQRIGKYLKLQFQGKNLTNPEIESVFRSKYISRDILRTRQRNGIELNVTLSLDLSF